jgi:hypothetical protein
MLLEEEVEEWIAAVWVEAEVVVGEDEVMAQREVRTMKIYLLIVVLFLQHLDLETLNEGE